MNSKTLHAILRTNFTSFIHKTFDTINPGTHYTHNWHIDTISTYLKNVRTGNIKRLIINIPPRSLKSICVSVAWPAWILGHDPTKRILVASHSHTLGLKHSMDCRFTISADWYHQVFPNTLLSKQHNQKGKFMTTSHGFRFSTSVGGSVTGEGGDILIIDDPHNPIYMYSTKMRNKVIDWFENTFSSRLNDRANGAIILVMQRLHENDLCGYLTRNHSNWEVLKLPAIFKDDIAIKLNEREWRVAAGEPLDTKRYGTGILKDLEQEIGVYNFAAQYLQSPIPKNAGMISASDIRTESSIPQHFGYYVLSWDTAIKTSDNADYSVCTVWGIRGLEYYLVHLFRKKVGYPELKASTYSLIAKYAPRHILIEDKASGQSLIQDLRAEGVHCILPQRPKFDKVTRFASVIELIQSGRIILQQNAPWYKEFIEEITTFPNGHNDDIVDSVSQFLHYARLYNNDVKIRVLDRL
jgi:predicted phage terminase large subunit-like protein